MPGRLHDCAWTLLLLQAGLLGLALAWRWEEVVVVRRGAGREEEVNKREDKTG